MAKQTSASQDSFSREKNMGFFDHLEELRWSIIRCFLAIVLAAAPFFIFYKFSLRIFTRYVPADGSLQNLAPVEGFINIVKTSVVGGISIALPYVLYEIWKFVAPGLYKHEKKLILPFIISGWGLFVAGALFCYFIVLQICLPILWKFGVTEGIQNQWQTAKTINFILGTMLGFGLAFDIPVILVALAMMGLVSSGFLSRIRPYSLLICLISGAILTPQDVMSMLLLAVPLYILYEASIIAIKIVELVKRRKAES